MGVELYVSNVIVLDCSFRFLSAFIPCRLTFHDYNQPTNIKFLKVLFVKMEKSVQVLVKQLLNILLVCVVVPLLVFCALVSHLNVQLNQMH